MEVNRLAFCKRHNDNPDYKSASSTIRIIDYPRQRYPRQRYPLQRLTANESATPLSSMAKQLNTPQVQRTEIFFVLCGQKRKSKRMEEPPVSHFRETFPFIESELMAFGKKVGQKLLNLKK